MERKNVFMKADAHKEFNWKSIGDIKKGRESLGEEIPVVVYRLMQFTMLDVLSKDLGLKEANNYFRKAGFLAGVGCQFRTHLN